MNLLTTYTHTSGNLNIWLYWQPKGMSWYIGSLANPLAFTNVLNLASLGGGGGKDGIAIESSIV